MAGAVLSLRAPSGVMVERLVSRGTAAAPVEIDADSGTVQLQTKLWLRAFSGSPLDTFHVEHTRLRGTRVDVGEGLTTLFEDLVVENGDCNIHGNAGVGLRNLAEPTVDARNNWWGDSQGPLGADGDGVAGNVEFVPFRTQPVDH